MMRAVRANQNRNHQNNELKDTKRFVDLKGTEELGDNFLGVCHYGSHFTTLQVVI